MVDTESGLIAGKVDPRHFELLLEGTSIRAPALIEALREHLVGGLSAMVQTLFSHYMLTETGEDLASNLNAVPGDQQAV
ncbi:hypothetical protein ALP73_200429 [Pseudomonas coronafaciens pv. garcae]|uniref:Uncharacterized protein n=2 Tax=Pseudomonas syringae group TaxID=136849 RepID=A0AB37QJK0_9PSED|nr:MULTISPECIES: PapB/FocB family fimbrial expression transcriptional regulator [Pseudomonas syringae group]KPY14361.1 hypothetical protein ALO54_200265 [Pseudomonas syringae pv. philadelphi]RMR95783.1 hypothetical protein ALP74_200367 [Pseudomonas coronafaciens pv. garcae]RMS05514.1 hypothetical protein ALP73_200429 [Pseudomonas coronafaciens pv. garcae]